MKKEQVIKNFFEDMTKTIKEEITHTGNTEPKAILLTKDSEDDYCVCGMTLPPSFGSDMTLERMFEVKFLISNFIKQVKEDGHEIISVLHCEMIESFHQGHDHIFLFKKIWNDDSEDNTEINTEFLKVNRKDVYVDNEGSLVHDIELLEVEEGSIKF